MLDSHLTLPLSLLGGRPCQAIRIRQTERSHHVFAYPHTSMQPHLNGTESPFIPLQPADALHQMLPALKMTWHGQHSVSRHESSISRQIFILHMWHHMCGADILLMQPQGCRQQHHGLSPDNNAVRHLPSVRCAGNSGMEQKQCRLTSALCAVCRQQWDEVSAGLRGRACDGASAAEGHDCPLSAEIQQRGEHPRQKR